jgi:hypothetical protein
MASSPKQDGSLRKVGPGNPPEHSRFRKGVSGNPNGRPRKERSLKNFVEAELDETVSLTENGRRVRLTKREVLAKKMVNDALTGDRKAQQALMRLVGGASEPENPTVAIDLAELAGFLAASFLRTRSPADDDRAAAAPLRRHGPG